MGKKEYEPAGGGSRSPGLRTTVPDELAEEADMGDGAVEERSEA